MVSGDLQPFQHAQEKKNRIGIEQKKEEKRKNKERDRRKTKKDYKREERGKIKEYYTLSDEPHQIANNKNLFSRRYELDEKESYRNMGE